MSGIVFSDMGGQAGTQDSKVLQPNNLLWGKALSSTIQPYLGELYAAVRKANAKVTLVAGAGLSMESGLPSWAGLIENIAKESLSDIDRQRIALIQADNIERQASVVLALANIHEHVSRRSEHIRKALLRGDSDRTPGLLAESLVRLAAVNGEARFITTNYDGLLEEAIDELHGENSSSSFSLLGVRSGDSERTKAYVHWKSLDPEAQSKAVLHLHGKVPWKDTDERPELPLSPLILTETDYLKHGPLIIEKLVESLEGRTAIFVGLSMTDPNLLAALRICEQDAVEGERYVVTVPTLHHPELTPLDCATMATQIARHLEQEYSLKPILVKTYAQTAQVISEAALAASHAKSHGLGGYGDLAYGKRLSQAVRAFYSALSVPTATKSGSKKIREDKSREFHRRLVDGRRADSLASVLKRLKTKYSGQVDPDEQMGVFVWLRNPDDFGGNTYSVRMVMSSVYHHWESDSGIPPQEVRGDSLYAAARSIYYGQRQILDSLNRPRDRGSWRSSTALPITFQATVSDDQILGAPVDQLIVGALAINSTSFMEGGDAGTVVDSKQMSVLSVASVAEVDEVFDSVIGDFMRLL